MGGPSDLARLRILVVQGVLLMAEVIIQLEECGCSVVAL